jgi:hypothetical protein
VVLRFRGIYLENPARLEIRAACHTELSRIEIDER